MDDLLQSQIREGCRLALPEGLKELMSDISREVLRSQPENLYEFIADYLEALLSAREALSIACRICGDVGNCSCEPQLDEELYRIGLSHENVEKAKNIILEHFDKGQVRETNLLIKLATKIDATEMQLAELQTAIQRAFQHFLPKRKDVQVSFAKFDDVSMISSQETPVPSVSPGSAESDFYKPVPSDPTSAIEDKQARRLYSVIGYPLCNASVSATTLAGSFVDLPHKIPYSVHNSECQNILVKSEKSVLRLLKSILFTERQQPNFFEINEPDEDRYHSLESSEGRSDTQIDDTIRNVFIQHIFEARSKNSKESQKSATFKVIQDNFDESSSGGS